MLKNQRFIIFWIIIVMLGTMTYAADWPHFLGPDANSISRETGLNKNWTANKPQLLWKVQLNNPGYAGPSVAGGMVFIMDRASTARDQDQINAYNINTGKLIWKYAYDEPSYEDYGYARATPTYDNGKIYTFSMSGILLCLEAKTGKKIWGLDTQKELNTKPPKWKLAGSPVVDGETLLICPGSPANLVALDKNTGTIQWKCNLSDPGGYATPVVANLNGMKQYLLFTGRNIIGVNPENGKVIWKYPWVNRSEVNVAAPLVFGEDQVFITSGYNLGCAMLKVNPDGEVDEVWANQDIASHISSPVLYQNFLYSNNDKDAMVCMDPQNGKVRWRQKGFEKGGLIIADGVILALDGQKGDLVMIKADPASYQELGRLKKPLGGQSWTAPILADGKLLIRNKEALGCLDLK